MPRCNFIVGDRVHVYASNNGKVANEEIFQTIVLPHGSGPFEVKGVGPTQISIQLPTGNKNIPHEWATRAR